MTVKRINKVTMTYDQLNTVGNMLDSYKLKKPVKNEKKITRYSFVKQNLDKITELYKNNGYTFEDIAVVLNEILHELITAERVSELNMNFTGSLVNSYYYKHLKQIRQKEAEKNTDKNKADGKKKIVKKLGNKTSEQNSETNADKKLANKSRKAQKKTTELITDKTTDSSVDKVSELKTASQSEETAQSKRQNRRRPEIQITNVDIEV